MWEYSLQRGTGGRGAGMEWRLLTVGTSGKCVWVGRLHKSSHQVFVALTIMVELPLLMSSLVSVCRADDYRPVRRSTFLFLLLLCLSLVLPPPLPSPS